MVLETRTITDTYENMEYTVNNLHGHYCDSCGESTHSREESQKIYEAIEQIKYNSPEKLILKIRKKIGLDQKRAGQVFGGGPNAFSRYETGKSKAPTPLITLFKLIDKYPYLVNDIQGLENISFTATTTNNSESHGAQK